MIHEYPTTLLESICWPIGDFIGHWWQQASHPSVATMICMGIVIKVSLLSAARAARASKTDQ